MKKSIALLAWNDGQASQPRALPPFAKHKPNGCSRRTLPHPTPRTGWPLPPRSMLNPESPENSRAGMRSETAVHRCLTEASAVEGDHRQAFPQVNLGAVGLAGLEPAPSSSGEDPRPRWQTAWYLPRSTRTSAPPRSSQRPRGRVVLPSSPSGVAAGHEPLTRDQRPSAVLTGVFAGPAVPWRRSYGLSP